MTAIHGLTGRMRYRELTSRGEELSRISAWYGRHRGVYKDQEDTPAKHEVPDSQHAGMTPSRRVKSFSFPRGVLAFSPRALATVGLVLRRFVAGSCHDPSGDA